MRRLVLAVDFDGVIHSYSSGWKGIGTVADCPTAGALTWLLQMLEHYDVQISSSRSKSLRGRWAMKRWLITHLARHFFCPSMEDERTAFLATHGDPWGHPRDTEQCAELWARRVVRKIKFPWFKPAAYLTIDDRALTFRGDFDEFDLRSLKLFRAWNKR